MFTLANLALLDPRIHHLRRAFLHQQHRAASQFRDVIATGNFQLPPDLCEWVELQPELPSAFLAWLNWQLNPEVCVAPCFDLSRLIHANLNSQQAGIISDSREEGGLDGYFDQLATRLSEFKATVVDSQRPPFSDSDSLNWAWRSNILRQSLALCVGGVQILRILPGNTPLCTQFDLVLGNYKEWFRLLAPWTDDPTHSWPKEEAPESDPDLSDYSPHMELNPYEMTQEAYWTTQLTEQLRCRITPGLSLDQLDTRLHEVESELRMEYELAQISAHLADLVQRLYRLWLMNWGLVQCLEHKLYTPLQNLAFFTDMHADLAMLRVED